MNLKQYREIYVEEMNKQAAAEEAETKDALEKFENFVKIGRDSAEADFKKIYGGK